MVSSRSILWFNITPNLVQFGIFFWLVYIKIYVLTYYHTPEQREIPNCAKGKIKPQRLYQQGWLPQICVDFLEPFDLST